MNDDTFREMLQILTKERQVGYVFTSAFRLIETFGDRGAILAVHVAAPYEFLYYIEGVLGMRAEYVAFLEQYPRSRHPPEARLEILWLDAYLLQCDLTAEEHRQLLIRIGETLDLLLEDLTDGTYREAIWSLRSCFEAALDARDPREEGLECFYTGRPEDGKDPAFGALDRFGDRPVMQGGNPR